MYILGIGQIGGSDSSATLIKDSELMISIDEERLSRIKHQGGFPEKAIKEVLKNAGVTMEEIAHVAIVDRPFYRFFARTFSWYLPKLFTHPRNALYHIFHDEIPTVFDFLKAKERFIRESNGKSRVHFVEHHLCHMASAFFVSPFEESAILTLDARGEIATTVLGLGRGNKIKKLQEARFPYSLGTFYAAITDHLGFRFGEDEYKVMGLASYGEPRYAEQMRKLTYFDSKNLLGMDLSYFSYQNGRGFLSPKFVEAFGPKRRYEEPIEQWHKDLAASAQKVLEEVILDLAEELKIRTRAKNICLAGGVALNCVANGKLAAAGLFDDIWIQPAAGDNGGSLGAAYYLRHQHLNHPRSFIMTSANVGPEYRAEEIEWVLNTSKVKYHKSTNICAEAARYLNEGKIVGWHQGKMESGPRALGSRSILADPTKPHMKDEINKYVKFREEFRPFAPSVKKEWCSKLFHMHHDSPFMLLIVSVRDEYKARLPAITHIDGTARVQSVDRDFEARYWQLLDEFEKLNGLPILLNTSFNVMGEPIVNTPEQALRCFYGSGIDVLCMGDYVVVK